MPASTRGTASCRPDAAPPTSGAPSWAVCTSRTVGEASCAIGCTALQNNMVSITPRCNSCGSAQRPYRVRLAGDDRGLPRMTTAGWASAARGAGAVSCSGSTRVACGAAATGDSVTELWEAPTTGAPLTFGSGWRDRRTRLKFPAKTAACPPKRTGSLRTRVGLVEFRWPSTYARRSRSPAASSAAWPWSSYCSGGTATTSGALEALLSASVPSSLDDALAASSAMASCS